MGQEKINTNTQEGRHWVGIRLKSNGTYPFLVDCGEGRTCSRRVSVDGITRCGDLTVLEGDGEGELIRVRVVCGVDHPIEMD